MNRRRAWMPLVLLVGGDAETARTCARAATPLPVVRAKHIGTATDRLRSMKPIALVVAADVSRDDIEELERAANGHTAHVLRFDDDKAPETLRRVARS